MESNCFKCIFKYFVEKHNLKATILLNSLELNDSSV